MNAPTDGRDVHRVVIDVLALPEQVEALAVILGTAICGVPDDHGGACRLAWRITTTQPGADLPDRDAVFTALSALEVWPSRVATADLLAEVHALLSAERAPER